MGMYKGARNFSSKKAYLKWNAYGHASKEFERTPGSQSIRIRGKPYTPKHSG